MIYYEKKWCDDRSVKSWGESLKWCGGECCECKTRIMMRYAKRYCLLCSRWPMAWQVMQSWVPKTSSLWVSVQCTQCCARWVSEKAPKCMWDMIYGLTDGNQCSNWASDGGGSSVHSRRGSGCRIDCTNKHQPVVYTWPVSSGRPVIHHSHM